MTEYDVDPTAARYGKTPSPIVWELQESAERDGGLKSLTIPCLTKDVAFAYADKRAGGLLNVGVDQGIDQSWQDYGNLPSGRDFVRQVCGPWRTLPAVWQHVRAGFVVTDSELG